MASPILLIVLSCPLLFTTPFVCLAASRILFPNGELGSRHCTRHILSLASRSVLPSSSAAYPLYLLSICCVLISHDALQLLLMIMILLLFSTSRTSYWNSILFYGLVLNLRWIGLPVHLPLLFPQCLLFLLYLQLFLNPLHAPRRKNLLVTTASPKVYVLPVTLTEHVFRGGGYGRLLEGIFVLVEYFKELEEESIQDNFVIIYELMDEMMDFGYPQTTESKILQEYITQESHKLEV